jgi:hypothetical protein
MIVIATCTHGDRDATSRRGEDADDDASGGGERAGVAVASARARLFP